MVKSNLLQPMRMNPTRGISSVSYQLRDQPPSTLALDLQDFRSVRKQFDNVVRDT